MKLKLTFAIFIVLLIVGGLVGVKFLQISTMIAGAKAFVPPPESVSSAVVREETWQNTLTAIGSITAVQGVTITPDIPGMVREISFESGAVVEKGTVLVRLDISSEEAQLRAIESQVELARINLERIRKLFKDGTVSQSELDTADSMLKQLEGTADTVKSAIEKKTIRAPFSGRLGIRLVNVGQYLDTGKPIVSLQALDLVYADFSLPQQELARLKTGMKVRLAIDAYPGRHFEGTLSAINPDLDASTRSIGLQASFENREHLLRPGMFTRVEVLLPEDGKVMSIPATAVISAPYGDSVYVIESKTGTNGASQLVVRQQFIRTGRARGDYLSVESGLKPGERIVSSGVFKLRNGMVIVENNDLAPKASEVPRPADS